MFDRRTATYLVSICCACVAISTSATSAADPIFASGAVLELLYTRQAKLNSGLTEGPAVAPDGTIYFTDMPFGEDRGHILRYDPRTGRTTTFTENSGKSNGLAFHPAGHLISCDGADGGGRRLVRWNLANGKSSTLVDSYQEQRLNSPNDLCIDSKGRIYFTDPRYLGVESRELKRQAVYRVDMDSNVIEITHDVQKPNGIVLSPDERTLYVGDHNNGADRPDPEAPPPVKGDMKVYAFPLDEHGKVCGPRRTLIDFGTQNGCDGMTVDSSGNIYVACRSLAKPGVKVIDPDGAELAFLPTGPEKQTGGFEQWKGIPSNVEFGLGPDQHTLYITIDKSLFRIRTKTVEFHHQLEKK